MFKTKVTLYYSIPDHFPSYRVDVTELFGVSLAKRGVHTEWFMANNGPDLLPHREGFFQQTCMLPPKFPGHGVLSKVLTKLAYWVTDSLLMVRAALHQFDILQTRDKYIAAVVALLAAKLAGKRFVHWCSYPFPEHALEVANERSGLLRLLLILNGKCAHFVLYRVVMRFADHSFVQSEQMLRDVAAYGVPVERMTPVPMGVPTRLLDWSSTHPSPVVPGRIVYLGAMSTVRRLHVMLDAFALVYKRCPAATFLMVGEGVKPQDRIALEQQAARLGLADVVAFSGFVPIETAWSLAASAAVCVSPVYPTRIFNCASPTKLYEYMALGRPVVCNAHPEQSAVIDESGAGLCVNWDVQAFADAMVWMLEHPELAEAMGEKGSAWVAANRTYDMLAAQVHARYLAILGR